MEVAIDDVTLSNSGSTMMSTSTSGHWQSETYAPWRMKGRRLHAPGEAPALGAQASVGILTLLSALTSF